MSSDGLFNVLIVLVRASVRLGPRPRQELLRACGADLAIVDPKQLNQTLIRWTELNLFESVDGIVTIAEPHRGLLGKNADGAESRLCKIVRRIALAPENNVRFWASEENRSADLSRGLSWILAQNVYTVDTASHAKIEPLENDQISDLSKRILQNDTRWNGLRTWMVYLGFGRPGAQVTIDPTEALRDVLPEIFDGQSTLFSVDFVEKAAEILPVLDGGNYRKKMEEILNPSVWEAPTEGRVSTSLSRAIQRLELEGFIAAEQRSDTEGGIILQGAGGRSWREMTHIRLLKPRKAT